MTCMHCNAKEWEFPPLKVVPIYHPLFAVTGVNFHPQSQTECAEFMSSTRPLRAQVPQTDRFSRFCTCHGRLSSGRLAPPGEYDSTSASFGPRSSSPQPKRQIDRFHRCCTAHGGMCILYTGRPYSQQLPLPLGTWTPMSSTQTASRSLLPCLQGSLV